MTGPAVLALEARVIVGEGVLFQQLQDEAVLLNLGSGQYFGLDPVGTRIWNLLAEGKSLPDVVAAIVAEYEVGQEKCEADLLKLVADLKAQRLVSVSR
jgi:hypothetical protein